MEHVARCKLCGWDAAWTTQEAAEFDSVWHVYLDHRDIWIDTMGEDRPPQVTNLPGAFGRKYEDWERQT